MLVACLVTLIATLYVADLQVTFEPHLLLPILNSIFLAAIPYFSSFTAARLFLSVGRVPLLLVGSGMLALGGGGLLSGWFIGDAGGPNITITIYNSSALLCSILLLFGEITISVAPAWNPFSNRVRSLLTMYLCVFVFVGGVVYLDTSGLIASFIVQGKGPTLLGRSVLILTIISFGLSAVLSLKHYYKSGTQLLRWYSTGLLLLATGLTGVLLQKIVGSPIGWVGRSSQYAGAVCILIGVLSFWRTKISTGLSLGETLAELSQKRISELEQINADLKQLTQEMNIILEYAPIGIHLSISDTSAKQLILLT